MFGRTFVYESKRILPLFLVWAAVSSALAVLARLRVFSLTDMPLFYLMLFSSVSIMLYRYYCSMHGKEAGFLFTVDLSSGKQLLLRYVHFAIWSVITALVIGMALSVQGEDMSNILQTLSITGKMLLAAEVAFSALTLTILISTALTLSYVHPFSEHRIAAFVIFLLIAFGLIRLLSKLTGGVVSSYLVVTDTGKVLRSDISDMPSSISFSFNTLIWDILCSAACMIGTPMIIRKKLVITN